MLKIRPVIPLLVGGAVIVAACYWSGQHRGRVDGGAARQAGERGLTPRATAVGTASAALANTATRSFDADFFRTFPNELRSRLRQDVRACWAWVRLNANRRPPDDEPPLAAQFMEALALTNPDGVIALARESLYEKDGDPAAKDIVSFAANALLATGNLAQARQFAETGIRDPRVAGEFVAAARVVALGIACESDRSAAEWVETLPVGEARGTALTAVVREWVNHDPAAAMQWAGNVTDARRDDAMRQAFALWSTIDVGSAAQWLLAHEETIGADRFVADLLRFSPLAHDRPDIALRWAELIREPRSHAAAVAAVVATWREHDPAAADRFAAQRSASAIR